MIWFILFAMYYIASWILFSCYYGRLYKIDWELATSIANAFGLGIFWLIPFWARQAEEARLNDPYAIKIENRSVSSQSGIQVTKDYCGKSYVYFNFPEEGYCGKIEQDTRYISLETLDTIVQKLKGWAKKEEVKNARIKAYRVLEE